MTQATGVQRQKQQERQMTLLRGEMRKAREMGISRESLAELVSEIYKD